MKKDNKYLVGQSVICLSLAILVASSSALAARTRDDSSDRSSRNRENEMELQKEQKRQEAVQSFPELENALNEILKSTSKNQQPSSEMLNRASGVLEENKRNGWAYDDKQKTQFMLLQAWTDYYQGNLADAIRWSMRACKTNEASQDAWISQAVFSMLIGKRPMTPRSDKPRERSPRRRNETLPMGGYESAVKPYSEKGQLEFDLFGLKTDLFHEQFGPMMFQAADNSKLEYAPGKDTLCILFWKIDEAASDSDISQSKKEQEPSNLPKDPMMGMGGMQMGGSYSSQDKTLQSQRDYVRKLKAACQENPEIKFVQINTNKVDALKKAAEQLVQDPYAEEAGSLVFAADPASNAQRYMALKADDPFLLIVDKEGKVKYAGTAADFVPAFILTELTGVDLDLDKINNKQQPAQPQPLQAQNTPQTKGSQPPKQNQPPSGMMPGMMPGMLMPGMMPADKPKLVDPNMADPNAIKARPLPSKTSKQSSGAPALSLEDQVRAGNLLRSAQLDIGADNKLRSNPKKGIEDCRKILAEFPNTEYAKQARELLRKVPEPYKKMNHITDEELGL